MTRVIYVDAAGLETRRLKALLAMLTRANPGSTIQVSYD